MEYYIFGIEKYRELQESGIIKGTESIIIEGIIDSDDPSIIDITRNHGDFYLIKFCWMDYTLNICNNELNDNINPTGKRTYRVIL